MIGPAKAPNNAGNNSIVIGQSSGSNIGANSIVIGKAGNASPSNMILLNATGANITPSTANAFYVAPLRTVVASNIMYYNPTTKEVTYDVLSNYAGNISATNANLGNLASANYFSGVS